MDKKSAYDQILAFFEVYGSVADNPPFEGGCPMLNTAVENDDGHPLLREKAKNTLERWKRRITEILIRERRTANFGRNSTRKKAAAFLIASLEGGIMLSKLENDNGPIRLVTEEISLYLKLCCCARNQSD